ncbi:MAG: type II secretion system protein, partial [Planctomycetota bacterium]
MRRRKGFTLVELLTTVSIISILLVILVPAVNMVRRMAKEAEQKAQFNTIGLALEAFKSDSDMGNYPESKWEYKNSNIRHQDYQGAQRLTEALVGWDLLGVHPDTAWRADGMAENGTTRVYPPRPINMDDPAVQKNLDERMGTYLENPTEHAFKLASRDNNIDDGLYYPQHFPGNYYSQNIQDTYVLCDVFKVRRVN